MKMGEIQAPVQPEELQFPVGLFGFPDVHRFHLVDVPGAEGILRQLVAVDGGSDLAFTVAYPFAFFPEYAPEIPDEELVEIGSPAAEAILLMTILNVPAKLQETTANLKAPIVVNTQTRQARQVILSDDRYPTKARLFRS
jgi:flagellar assembly factor FliW